MKKELLIIPAEISLVDFYGQDEEWISLIKNKNPNLKIYTRGYELRVEGDKPDEIETFKQRVQYLIVFINKYGVLDKEKIEKIFGENTESKEIKEEITEKSEDKTIFHSYNSKPIKPISEKQNKYVEQIKDKDMVFAMGPAGTGKTYLAVVMAVHFFKIKQVSKIVITRPAVEAGENLGFLPGDIKEKLDPYLQPLYDALLDLIPKDKLKYLMDENKIEIAPLAYMRGRTLSNAFVILDEAQNTTPIQMKMFLTRMGKNTKFVITGDPSQADILPNKMSGLTHAQKTLEKIKEIGFSYFTEKDVVRHPIVKKIILAYDKDDRKP